MANLSNINNKFLFTDGDFLKIGNSAPINNVSSTESGISITNPDVASITLDNTGEGGKTFVIYSDDGGKLNFFDVDANSVRLQIEASGDSIFVGNVGIGVAPSDGNLHVRKTGVNTGITNVLMNANFADGSNGTGLSIGYRTDETTAVLAARTATGNIAFYSYDGGWSESMRIKNNGNVGIGASLPGAKLEVNANSATLTQEILKVKGGGSGGAYGFLVEANNGDDLFKVDTLNYNSYFTNGSVGIGTTSPAAGSQLTLRSSASTGMTILSASNTGECFINFSDNDDLNVGQIFYGHSPDRMVFRVGDDSRMTILGSNGNVGIGITSPDAKLDVLQETRISYLQGNQYRTRITNTDGNTRILSDGQQCNIIFGTTGNVANGTASEVMRLNWEGKLGIGTTSPLKLLTVKKATSTNTIATSEVMRLAGTAQVVGNKNELGFANYDNDFNASVVIGAEIMSTAAYLKQDLYFATRDSTSDIAPTERMRITSAGLVEIKSNSTTQASFEQTLAIAKQLGNSGVAIPVAYVDHTHSLDVTVIVKQDTSNVSVGKGSSVVAYGSGSASLSTVRGSGNVSSVSIAYLNTNPNGQNYVLTVTPTFNAGNPPIAYVTIRGNSTSAISEY